MAAYDQILEILHNAQLRKDMYFLPVGPIAVTHWIHGLRAGFSFAGLEWSADHRRTAVERRGLEFHIGASEVPQLRERGLTDQAIADELLAIEIEMWKSQRECQWSKS